jgi:hypothetical protein
MSSWRGNFPSSSIFPFWCLDANRGEGSYLYRFSSLSSVLVMSCTCGGRGMDKNFLCVACKTFMEIEPYLYIYLCMVEYYAYPSMYDYVMYLWLCLVDSC